MRRQQHGLSDQADGSYKRAVNTINPLGTKGCGEAGCAGSLVCIVNAVLDALSEYGVTHLDMPLTPERVWAAMQPRRS